MTKGVFKFVLILLIVATIGIATRVSLIDLYYSDSFFGMKIAKDSVVINPGSLKPYQKDDETMEQFLQAINNKDLESVVAPADYEDEKFRQFEKFYYDANTEVQAGDWVATAGTMKAYSMKVAMGDKVLRPVYFFEKSGNQYLHKPFGQFNAYSAFLTGFQHKKLKPLGFVEKAQVLLSPNVYSFALNDESGVFFEKAESREGYLFSFKMAGKTVSVIDKKKLPDNMINQGHLYLNQNDDFALEYSENGEVINNKGFAFTKSFFMLPHFSGDTKMTKPTTSLVKFFNLWFVLLVLGVSVILFFVLKVVRVKQA
ncbi:hypothetical protein [Kangiella shandongensis]|uniref:hypothetical protein n=1 Tax=Kangiella shandongensis TaxID=2763258 RepID=UPI001CBE3272|nr:hypothetical protein [Kangiella shandongensis]